MNKEVKNLRVRQNWNVKKCPRNKLFRFIHENKERATKSFVPFSFSKRVKKPKSLLINNLNGIFKNI